MIQSHQLYIRYPVHIPKCEKLKEVKLPMLLSLQTFYLHWISNSDNHNSNNYNIVRYWDLRNKFLSDSSSKLHPLINLVVHVCTRKSREKTLTIAQKGKQMKWASSPSTPNRSKYIHALHRNNVFCFAQSYSCVPFCGSAQWSKCGHCKILTTVTLIHSLVLDFTSDQALLVHLVPAVSSFLHTEHSYHSITYTIKIDMTPTIFGKVRLHPTVTIKNI